MQPISFESVTVDEIDLPILKERNISLAVLRLDKIHAVISGNKWFKLKYYLEDARNAGKDHILTFGGAYSNHIVATAAAGKLLGFKTTGVIRGERPESPSPTLLQSIYYGMELIFVSREDYRNKKIPPEIMSDDFYKIDEGGYGINGAKGAAEILNYCKIENYSHIACAVGTSTMLAGVIKASLPQQQVFGIAVLKNNNNLEKGVYNLLSQDEQRKKFQITHSYHFNGYAKYTTELINFMNEYYRSTAIPTDFVYTGKLFYAVVDMIRNNSLPGGSHVLVIHSGGLQGNLSLPAGTLIF
jgi:1-aminocyclopropane-1-carboxylate deaminase